MKFYYFVWRHYSQVLDVEKKGGHIIRIGQLYVEYYATEQLH